VISFKEVKQMSLCNVCIVSKIPF